MIAKRMSLFFLLSGFAALMSILDGRNAMAQVSGALFTTDADCTGVDLNIYTTKESVYIDGGPTRKGLGTGLPDGAYYVRVTTPDGKTLLGYTPSPIVQVTGGEFSACYQLSGILESPTTLGLGYDDTLNNGGEYKVWISQNPYFLNRESKTDNFKVVPSAGLDSDGDGVPDEDDVCPGIDDNGPECVSVS